ncbi:DUF935 domain-containing protein [Acidimangrovimonas sediminis]|uniref:DUF935 domain-containing protein n=1 Tax=Acidimangrovimonas sediminis TaxID=2056283 RepID=UPI000C80561C|nr:DUF935 domain-containing protein [Acidimangrovimonas sediminis]
MAKTPTLLDQWGRPVRKAVLTEEISGPTLAGVRSPIAGTPADGLTPVRLASILREADHGEAVRYLELAEVIEERDPHYLGVLGTRRRSVSQIDVTVEAASDAARDVEIADMVRDWLERDELQEELFDILDSIGKGYSFTEIIWDTSEGQWQPQRLEWRDPRWFRWEQRDLTTPLYLADDGTRQPLEPFKYIFARMKAKSGIPARSGLARVAAWGWMFKAFTQRDWAIFTQTYGQPLRVGKYGAGSSKEDRDTLFRAVANIAGDCAAIISQSMEIEFVESKNVGPGSDLYEKRSDWLDRQISKAVLGQTATTDAIAGGHAVGQEHRQVQEDIERADAKALSAILNRDLIRPWVDLEYGPQERYPRLVIARPEVEDIGTLADALAKLVPLGLKVQASEVRDRAGFSDPEENSEVLGATTPQNPPPNAPNTPPEPGQVDPSQQDRPVKHFSGEIKRGLGLPGVTAAPQAEGPSAGKKSGGSPQDLLTDRMEIEAGPEIAAMIDQVEAMLSAASSLDEFRSMLLEAFPSIDSSGLARVMAAGMMAAEAAGRTALEADSG